MGVVSVVGLLMLILIVTYNVQVGDSVNPDLAGDLMVTTTPILNIDRLPDYQYAGLPLGQSASDAWWIKCMTLTLLQVSTPTTTARGASAPAGAPWARIVRRCPNTREWTIR